MSEDNVALNIQIPKPLAQALADYKTQTGVSITAFVRKAIEDRLKFSVVEGEPETQPSPLPEIERPAKAHPLACRAPAPRLLTVSNALRVVGKVSE